MECYDKTLLPIPPRIIWSFWEIELQNILVDMNVKTTWPGQNPPHHHYGYNLSNKWSLSSSAQDIRMPTALWKINLCVSLSD